MPFVQLLISIVENVRINVPGDVMFTQKTQITRPPFMDRKVCISGSVDISLKEYISQYYPTKNYYSIECDIFRNGERIKLFFNDKVKLNELNLQERDEVYIKIHKF